MRSQVFLQLLVAGFSKRLWRHFHPEKGFLSSLSLIFQMLLKTRCPVKSRKIGDERGKHRLMKNVKCNVKEMLGNSHKNFFLLEGIATFQPYVTILVAEMNPHSLTWKLFSILGIVGLNNIKANDYLNVVLQVLNILYFIFHFISASNK